VVWDPAKEPLTLTVIILAYMHSSDRDGRVQDGVWLAGEVTVVARTSLFPRSGS
jgi:hypothetical protein